MRDSTALKKRLGIEPAPTVGWWTDPEWREEVARSQENSRVFRVRLDCRNRPRTSPSNPESSSGIYYKDVGLRDIPTLGPFGPHLPSKRLLFDWKGEVTVSPGTIFTSAECDVPILGDYPDSEPEISDEDLDREDQALDETEQAEQEKVAGDRESWLGDQNTATGRDNRGKEFLGGNDSLGSRGTVGHWTKKWTEAQLANYLRDKSSLDFGWVGKCKPVDKTVSVTRLHSFECHCRIKRRKDKDNPSATWRELVPTGRLTQHDGLGWEVYKRFTYPKEAIEEANESWEPERETLLYPYGPGRGVEDWGVNAPSATFWLFGDSTNQRTPPRHLGYEWFDRLSGKTVAKNEKTLDLLVEKGFNAEDWVVVDIHQEFLVRTYPDGNFRVKKWGRELPNLPELRERVVPIQDDYLKRKTIARYSELSRLLLPVLGQCEVWSELWELSQEARRKKDRDRKPSVWNEEKHGERVVLSDGREIWIPKAEIREDKKLTLEMACPICSKLIRVGEPHLCVGPLGGKQ